MPNETEKETIQYPNIVERFREVFQKLGIKRAEGYVDHCAKGDLENLDDIEQKLYEMGLHPSLRTQVINFWAAEIKQPVPRLIQKRLAEERGTKVRGQSEGEREPEKYSVDTETGAIKVASTTDKTALTWDEAEKLSKNIKTELAAKGDKKTVEYVYDTETEQVRMAKEEERGGTLEQAKELKRMAKEGKGEGLEKEEERKEKEKAKYSVDEDTGTIKVATTSEKALTWGEAEKLSKSIKKEAMERGKGKPVTYVYDTETRQVRMAREGEVGGSLEEAKELKRMAGAGKGEGEEGEEEERVRAKYSVDEDTGVIKVATTKEKALTWGEAEKLSKSIKREVMERGKGKPVTYVYDTETRQVRMAREGEIGGSLEEAKELKRMAGEGKGEEGGESPFITDEEGNWTLNPRARVTGVELMALESIRRSQDRGEPVDPVEVLGKAAEKMRVYQEAFGGGAGKMPDWMTDPTRFFETVQTIAGGGKGDEELKEKLAQMSKTIENMKEEKYREQIASQQAQIRGLTDKVEELVDHVADLKRPVTGRTEIDILHEVASQGIDLAKSELPGFRRDIREAFAGTRLPPAKTPEEREERKKRYRKGLEIDREIEEIGRDLFFGEQAKGSSPP